MKTTKISYRNLLVPILGCCLLSPLASRADRTWVGGTSSDWNTPANWSGGIVPTAEIATINTAAGNIATVSNVVTARPTFLKIGDANTGILNVLTGGVLTNTSETWIGNTTSGVGTNNINGGSVVGGSWYAVGRGGGKGTLNVTSGSLTVSGNPLGIGLDGNTVGVLNQSGGSIFSGSDLWVGNGSGSSSRSTATYNLSGGSITVNSWLVIGRQHTTGTLNMSGGSMTKTSSGNNFLIGVDVGSSTGIINQTGGTITNLASDTYLSAYNHGTGTWNLDGGSAVLALLTICLGNNSDSIGTMNLNTNGTLAVARINGNSGPATSTFNFNGGTLVATGPSATFMSGLTRANVRNGGAIIDDGGNAVVVGQSLLHSAIGGDNATDGGLTKLGAGTLELTGASTYTGDTKVLAGTLQFDVTGSLVGAVRITNGATLNLNFSGDYVVGGFYTNGVVLAAGSYNAGNLPAFITGSGNLLVSSSISSGLWDGGGANNLWSTAANWDNNAVPIFPHAATFAGNVRTNNTNDLSSITVSTLTFDSNAAPYTVNGNDITLSGSLGFNGNPPLPVTQVVNLGMTWTANQAIDTPPNGNITLGGNIVTSPNVLTKTGNGTLTLTGTDTFSGYILNNGTNRITGNVSIAGDNTSRFSIGNASTNFNGTLVIEPGANLSVSGGFVDNSVIGRDGGSGTVIQNGGTFNFSMANQAALYLGATGNAKTRSDYYMNGGVFDMGGLKLGVGLGAGVLITGAVHQVSGVITNVGWLELGTLTPNGFGQYDLTGGQLYIGGSGLTTINGLYKMNLGGGTLGASTSWASTLNLTLTGSNGPVTFDTALNTITLTGVLSGPGGLRVAGGGTLQLGGGNTYNGDTFVDASTLEFDVPSVSAGAMRITNGATLLLTHSGTNVVGGLYTNGVSLGNGVYSQANTPFITGSGYLEVVGAVSLGVWDGGGANNNWSTAANWDNNAVPIFPHDLTFAGSARLANTNDLTGVTLNGVTFDSAAGAFTLNGNDISLNGPIGFNGNPVSPINQTVNLNMTWNSDTAIDTTANGNIVIGGNITGSSQRLTKTSGANAGTLTLAGTNNVASFIVNGGTCRITGSTTVTGTGTSRFALANASAGFDATLVIENGANFTVNGSFIDNSVIGRDGGIGTVTQNGGTFSFSMANHDSLFLGATGNANTRSTYNMNGGLLDMNGLILGVSLGAGVTTTGVVNQAGGVITNVGKLDMGAEFGQGYGEYNLTGGKIYIGSDGITTVSGLYNLNLGGGTVGALASWSSALNLNLTDINGSVTFDTAGFIVGLSGNLGGTGGLVVAGGGVLSLTNASTYTGQTLVNQGTLELLSPTIATSAIKLANGAILNLNHAETNTVPSFYTNNVSLPTGYYNSANMASFITGTGTLQVGSSVPSSPTNITFSATGGTLSLSWPASYVGWILQRQTNSLSVGLKTNWTDIPESVGITSTNIAINPAAPTVFYRLRHP